MATLTPFRYPGSKNKLLPFLLPHLDAMLDDDLEVGFADVFVGGGSIVLEMASRYPSLPLFLNDKDSWIASFWKAILDESSCHQLLSLLKEKPTIKLFHQLRNEQAENDIQRAYRAIFFNRTCFSGILTSGPIGGEEQRSQYSIDCRYNYPVLEEKIIRCHNLLTRRSTVSNLDAIDFCRLYPSVPLYLDPPYFVKGGILYPTKMSQDDHRNLAILLNQRTNWVLSYDDAAEVRELYKENRIIDLAASYCIDGKKTAWKNKNELIILPNEERTQ